MIQQLLGAARQRHPQDQPDGASAPAACSAGCTGARAEKIDPNQMALFAEMLKQLEAQNPPAEPASAPAAPPALPSQRPRPAKAARRPAARAGDPRPARRREALPLLRHDAGRHRRRRPASSSTTCRPRSRSSSTCGSSTSARPARPRPPEGGPQIATAEKPLSPIEKGLAAPGLLAYVIVSKYCDHLPLHRLERILERHGIDIARSTMCDWMRQSAEALRPLYDLMVQEVLASQGDPHRRHAGGRAGPQAGPDPRRAGSGSTWATRRIHRLCSTTPPAGSATGR